MEPRKIRFGDLKIGPLARRKIAEALDRNWVTEGPNVREFEEKYAEKFGWKHCIATSSGTTAGEIVWAAMRELNGFEHTAAVSDSFHELVDNEMEPQAPFAWTPACVFVATASCLLAAGVLPGFVDIDLDTLNISREGLKLRFNEKWGGGNCIGINFIATMGKPTPIKEVAKIAESHNLYLIGDCCEGHGARVMSDRSDPFPHDGFNLADHYCDVATYSFYVAHMVVGGEGGCVCTDDDEIAELCKSIKSHGRPAGSNYFDFQRIGFNAKWNDLCAAIALESLERFDETLAKRRAVRAKLLQALEPFEDRLILYRDAPGEVIAPHAFPIVLRDENADIVPLYRHMERADIEVKTLFGSLPTQHKAFEFLGHKLGDFPVAERIGKTGLHFGCSEHMTDRDVDYIHGVFKEYFERI